MGLTVQKTRILTHGAFCKATCITVGQLRTSRHAGCMNKGGCGCWSRKPPNLIASALSHEVLWTLPVGFSRGREANGICPIAVMASVSSCVLVLEKLCVVETSRCITATVLFRHWHVNRHRHLGHLSLNHNWYINDMSMHMMCDGSSTLEHFER